MGLDMKALIDENLRLREDYKRLDMKNKLLVKKLRDTLITTSDTMITLICIKSNLDFYRKFKYSTSQEFLDGYNKAFDLIEKILNLEVKKEC